MSFKYLKHLALTSTSWALSSSDDILVGGQAVIEGVMMRSPKGYSVAVRRQDGTVRIMKDALRTVGETWRAFKLPILRGIGVLGQALVLGIRALRFSAEEALAEETRKQDVKEAKEIKKEVRKEESTVSSWLIAGNLVIALGINILLFVALPLFLTRLLQTEIGFQSSLLFNGIDGLIRVAVFVLFLYSVSWMKDMNRVFQYHGAEHKTVYNFEAREELNVENARRFSTLHPRCGTSFLLVVMVVSILVFSVVRFDGFTAKLLSRIVLLPLVAGISYEIIRYSAKHPRSLLRIVTFPGLLLQKITTKPPDDTQLDIAIVALREALTL
ncbi:MAG TPA: DUF1385 domain-containing protein [Terriglobia bacterium]|nr:DUF1385 domain-containing protein [Terriglobia bacterium]